MMSNTSKLIKNSSHEYEFILIDRTFRTGPTNGQMDSLHIGLIASIFNPNVQDSIGGGCYLQTVATLKMGVV